MTSRRDNPEQWVLAVAVAAIPAALSIPPNAEGHFRPEAQRRDVK